MIIIVLIIAFCVYGLYEWKKNAKVCSVCQKKDWATYFNKYKGEDAPVCNNCYKKAKKILGDDIDKMNLKVGDIQDVLFRNEKDYAPPDDVASSNFVNDMNELDKKYKKNYIRHFELLNNYKKQYSVAKRQDEYNKEVKKLIDLCTEDIEIIEDFLAYEKGRQKIYGWIPFEPRIPSFHYLGVTYEKWFPMSIGKALLVYQYGDILDVEDGTSGSCRGRIAFLLKKINKVNKRKINYNYDEHIFYYDDTGEIIEDTTTIKHEIGVK